MKTFELAKSVLKSLLAPTLSGTNHSKEHVCFYILNLVKKKKSKIFNLYLIET